MIKTFGTLYLYVADQQYGTVISLLLVLVVNQSGSNFHYCLVSLMWMKIGSNDITAQVPGVS
jgi:hypothetical protein